MESLLGLHSVEGVREITEADGTRVLLIRLDSEVLAIFVRGWSNRVQVERLRDGQWPFLSDHTCQRHGEEMETSNGESPLVCNFLRRPSDLELRRANASKDPIGSRPIGSRLNAIELVAIDEARNLIVLEIGAGASTVGILPINSDRVVQPNIRIQITARPQFEFSPKRLIIAGNPSDWVVCDIRINNRSQFLQCGDIPGDLFTVASIDAFVLFETVQPNMDVVLIANYIGPHPEGSMFFAGLLNSSALRPHFTWTPNGRFEPWLAGSLDPFELADKA